MDGKDVKNNKNHWEANKIISKSDMTTNGRIFLPMARAPLDIH